MTKDNFITKNYAENMNFYLLISKLLRDFKKKYPTDLIVHTNTMHEKLLEINSGFCREIITRGIRIK